MHTGLVRGLGIISFLPKRQWKNISDSYLFFFLLKYDYSNIFLISLAALITLLIFILFMKKYLEVKKYKLPFFHIYNILNGNTINYFIENKIKVNQQYFDNLKLVLKTYDEFKFQRYSKKITHYSKFDNSLVIVIALFLNPLILVFGILQINSDYYITHLIVTVYLVLLLAIASLLNIKINVNKYHTENIYYKEAIGEWEKFNYQLSDNYNFINIYNEKLSKTYNNQKIYFKDSGNRIIKIRLSLQNKNYNNNIFKDQTQWEYFNKVLPWDLISTKKRGN
ncbi:hypothetical protein CO229_00060 [Mycoplasmopsis bovirhinis]|nr:hypothetical protein CO229_00060 [Mycoplasmopsis bovirhinis]